MTPFKITDAVSPQEASKRTGPKETVTTKPQVPKMLQSAFINEEDIDLPRLRTHSRRDLKSSTINSPDIIDSHNDTDHEIGQTNDDGYDDANNDADNKIPINHEPKQEFQGSEIPTEKPRKKRGRPKKGSEKTAIIHTILDQDDRRSIAARKSKRASTKQVSLLQSKQITKPNRVQKPLQVEVERLTVESNKTKRSKVNTLDVIKHLIKDFEPDDDDDDHNQLEQGEDLDNGDIAINSSMVQKEFKTHLMDHFKHLADVHGSIDDLIFEINSIEKQKQELRKGLFQLRAHHSQVGNDLNKLRDDYQTSRQGYDKFNELISNIDQIKNGLNKDNNINQYDLLKSIDNEILTMGKLFNPTHGLNQQLIDINSRLEQVRNNN